MGLDIVEFVMNVEETFGVAIPDHDAERILTPRMLIDYLYGRLGHGRRAGCLSQQGFYALRREIASRVGLPARQLRPATKLRPLLSKQNWAEIGTVFGEKPWAQFWYRSWPFGWRVPETLGLAARDLAFRGASCFLPDDPLWDEIARKVDELVREFFPVPDYSLDDSFLDLSL